MRVLLTGATGYVGRRLEERLLNESDVCLRLLVRDARRIREEARHRAEVVEGDFLDEEVLGRAVSGIEVAYYPIRFFWADRKIGELHRSLAEGFRNACVKAGVKRIVYLGFLGSHDFGNDLLLDMLKAGETLSATPDKIETVWLRAGLVIGSGSALFEVLSSLVEKIPVIFTPQWMETRVRPIGIADLLDYLVLARHVDSRGALVVDIGLEPMSLREMLKGAQEVMGLRRIFIPLPFTGHRLFSFMLMLVTPFSYNLSSLFVDGMRPRRTAPPEKGNDPTPYFPARKPLPFRMAFQRAVSGAERDQGMSRWTDSLAGISYSDPGGEIERAVYRDVKSMDFGDLPKEKIFRAVKSVGGKSGWFTFDILWKIRGVMDKLIGGFGTSVGKRDESDLRIGDMLDVWKVVDLRKDERLLLEAHMKVAGKAWLEFRIEGNTLIQTASHDPEGLLGRLYWYSMIPFHFFIFRDMVRSIVRRAREMDDPPLDTH